MEYGRPDSHLPVWYCWGCTVKIEYGTEVIDRNGKVLGTVAQVIRNTWTGEISKFMVRRKASGEALFFSPQDVLEVTKSGIKVAISLGKLNEMH